MKNTFLFIGVEKVINNIYRYGYSTELLPKKLGIITTRNIADRYSRLGQQIKFDSKWSERDIHKLHLYFLLKNFLNRKNKALNYELRSRIFGPYKIRTPKKLFLACKYFSKNFFIINWLFLLNAYNFTNHDLLLALRAKRQIGPGDVDTFRKIIKENSIEKMITFTAFRDPKIYDLAEACAMENCELHVLPECWDNISSGYGFPSKISKFYLWSQQQLRDLRTLDGKSSHNASVIGSYRRTYAKNFVKNEENGASDTLNILYLEGYSFENLNFVLSKLTKSISVADLDDNLKNVKITIRRYPRKRQTIDKPKSVVQIGDTKIRGINIIIKNSSNSELNLDFYNKDLVISELTTAGLEACFRNIPTIFIGSQASIKFLDTARFYKFSFAKDLVHDGLYINLSRFTSVNKLASKLSTLLNKNYSASSEKFSSKKFDFYAEDFDFTMWENLID